MFIKKIASMDASRINYLLVTVLFCCIAYFSLGYSDDKGYFIDTHYTGTQMPLDWTATEVAEWAGGADVGTYINAAKYYINNGEFEDWVVNLFSPGQIYYTIFLIQVTGEEYLPLKYMVTSVVAWLLVFLSATAILNRNFAHIGIPFLVLSPMYFTQIREYMFGYGVLGAEMLSMPIFVLLVFVALLFNKEYENKYYLGSMGVVLALLAYMKAYFEIFGNILIVFLAAYIFLHLVIRFVQLYGQGEAALTIKSLLCVIKEKNGLLFDRRLRAVLVILLVFVLLLLPWRFSNMERGFTMSWLHAGYYWSVVWKTDENTHSSFTQTGINTPCRTDNILCNVLDEYESKTEGQSIPNSLYGKLAVFTFLTKPITWYKNKLLYFDNLWYGNHWRNELEQNTWGFFQGLILIISPLIFFIYYSLNWKNADAGYRSIYIFSSVFIVFNIMLLTMLHFEMRYAIFLKLLFIVMLALILHDLIRKKLEMIQAGRVDS